MEKVRKKTPDAVWQTSSTTDEGIHHCKQWTGSSGSLEEKGGAIMHSRNDERETEKEDRSQPLIRSSRWWRGTRTKFCIRGEKGAIPIFKSEGGKGKYAKRGLRQLWGWN